MFTLYMYWILLNNSMVYNTMVSSTQTLFIAISYNTLIRTSFSVLCLCMCTHSGMCVLSILAHMHNDGWACLWMFSFVSICGRRKWISSVIIYYLIYWSGLSFLNLESPNSASLSIDNLLLRSFVAKTYLLDYLSS